eukprot:Awhi_evm1s12758
MADQPPPPQYSVDITDSRAPLESVLYGGNPSSNHETAYPSNTAPYPPNTAPYPPPSAYPPTNAAHPPSAYPSVQYPPPGQYPPPSEYPSAVPSAPQPSYPPGTSTYPIIAGSYPPAASYENGPPSYEQYKQEHPDEPANDVESTATLDNHVHPPPPPPNGCQCCATPKQRAFWTLAILIILAIAFYNISRYIF